jgi:dephospho-CoA kinase
MKKLVILVSGKLQSGKNSLADILKEEIQNQYKIPVATDYFARLLKEMCRDSFKPLTNYLNEIFSDVYEMEGNFCGHDFQKLITTDESWFEKKNNISRMTLQIVGTEIVRAVNENFWSESFIKRTNDRKETIVLNSDCRFKSEIEQVEKNFTTVCIRIERKMERNEIINEHISEKALDDKTDWDYLIHNDGTLEELRSEAKKIVQDLGRYFRDE